MNKKMKRIISIFVALLFIVILPEITIAQDWANLNRFKEENMELKKSDSNENRIVFMGNSITEMWKELSPSNFFDNKSYINRGISGQTTPQMLLRFRQDVVDLQPNIVVILAGINDIAENTGPTSLKNIMDNIKSMTEIAQANNIKVVLCSVLPANDFSWNPDIKPTELVIDLNKLIMKYALENSLPYVDYYTPMVDDKKGLKKELGVDSVHPNSKGYAVMEEILKENLSYFTKQ